MEFSQTIAVAAGTAAANFYNQVGRTVGLGVLIYGAGTLAYDYLKE